MADYASLKARLEKELAKVHVTKKGEPVKLPQEAINRIIRLALPASKMLQTESEQLEDIATLLEVSTGLDDLKNMLEAGQEAIGRVGTILFSDDENDDDDEYPLAWAANLTTHADKLKNAIDKYLKRKPKKRRGHPGYKTPNVIASSIRFTIVEKCGLPVGLFNKTLDCINEIIPLAKADPHNHGSTKSTTALARETSRRKKRKS